VAAVVVDCEAGPVRLRLAGVLAEALGAEYLSLGELSVDVLAGSVRAVREARAVRGEVA
jgi:magnesium chelatase subunit D